MRAVDRIATPARPSATFLRAAAGAVGAVFVLVGVLGFVPATVTDHDQLAAAGHHTDARLFGLFGLFAVTVLHNVVHLGFGVLGLVLAARAAWSAAYLVYGGLVYAALWIYGLVAAGTEADVVGLNDADNWLHLGLAVGMVGLGIAGYRWWRGGVGGDAPM